MQVVRCTSCNKETEEYVEFKCPSCGRTIIRCLECRSKAVRWTCPSCGFQGP